MANINNKYYSDKQEKLVADSLGWKVVTGSGSRNLYPGDVQSDEWLGECKTHTSPGHKIVFYASVWKKICDEAVSKYKFPVLFVDDGSQNKSFTWCMFKLRPAVEHHLITFPFTVQDNLSFKSETLVLDRGTRIQEDVKPVVYVVKREKGVCFISWFHDFVEMFGEV